MRLEQTIYNESKGINAKPKNHAFGLSKSVCTGIYIYIELNIKNIEFYVIFSFVFE